MKKNILFFILGLTTTSLVSFKILNQNSRAIVNEYEGVFIFTDSKPESDNYEVVDNVNLGVIFSGSKEYYYQKKRIIKLAKEKGKDFDAIIFEDDSKKSIQGTLIKFK